MPEGEEAAPMSGQSVTLEDFTDAVSASVSASVAGMLEDVSQRLDGLESGLQAVSENVQAVSDSTATREDVQAASASLSASLEEATLQGEEIGPVLAGELLEVFLKDEQALILSGIRSDTSDALSIARQMQSALDDVSGVLVHPALETPLSDYSVMEALLLLLVFWQVVKLCLSMLRGGFGWLMR